MREALYLLTYGLMLIAGVFLVFAWGAVAVRAYRAHVGRWWRDRFFIVALGLTLNSAGMIALFGTRTLESFTRSVWAVPGTVGLIILMSLLVTVFSKTVLVWAVALKHQSVVWRSFMLMSLSWSLFAIWWVLG